MSGLNDHSEEIRPKKGSPKDLLAVRGDIYIINTQPSPELGAKTVSSSQTAFCLQSYNSIALICP